MAKNKNITNKSDKGLSKDTTKERLPAILNDSNSLIDGISIFDNATPFGCRLPENTIFYHNETKQVLYNIDRNIKAFQFKVHQETLDGVPNVEITSDLSSGHNLNPEKLNLHKAYHSILDDSAPGTIENDFTVLTSTNTLVAFSNNNKVIPRGCGTLVSLNANNWIGYLKDIVFVDEDNNKIHVKYYNEGIHYGHRGCGYIDNYTVMDLRIPGMEGGQGNISPDGSSAVGPFSYYGPSIDNFRRNCNDGRDPWGENKAFKFPQHTYYEDILTNPEHQPFQLPTNKFNWDIKPFYHLDDKQGYPLYTLYVSKYERPPVYTVNQNDNTQTIQFTLKIKSNFDNTLYGTQPHMDLQNLTYENLLGTTLDAYVCKSFSNPNPVGGPGGSNNPWTPESWLTTTDFAGDDYWYFDWNDFPGNQTGFNPDDDSFGYMFHIRGFCNGLDDPKCATCDQIESTNILHDPLFAPAYAEFNWSISMFLSDGFDPYANPINYTGAGISEFLADPDNPLTEESNLNVDYIQNGESNLNWIGVLLAGDIDNFGSFDENTTFNPLSNCYRQGWDVLHFFAMWTPETEGAFTYSGAVEPEKIIGSSWTDGTHTEDGVILWSFNLTIPGWVDNINNVNIEHVVDFINSFGCFQDNYILAHGSGDMEGINGPRLLYYNYVGIDIEDFITEQVNYGCTAPNSINCISHDCCGIYALIQPSWFPQCLGLPTYLWVQDEDLCGGDNSCCITRFVGCTDPTSYTFESNANVLCEGPWSGDIEGLLEDPVNNSDLSCSPCQYHYDCECDGEILYGDVNCNGTPQITDIIMMIQHILFGSTLNCFSAGDPNGDNVVDILDVNQLIECVQNPDSTDPVCTTYISDTTSNSIWNRNITIFVDTQTWHEIMTPQEYYEGCGNNCNGAGIDEIDNHEYYYKLIEEPQILGNYDLYINHIEPDGGSAWTAWNNTSSWYKANLEGGFPIRIDARTWPNQDFFSYNIKEVNINTGDETLLLGPDTPIGLPIYYGYVGIHLNTIYEQEGPTWADNLGGFGHIHNEQVIYGSSVDIPLTDIIPHITWYGSGHALLNDEEIEAFNATEFSITDQGYGTAEIVSGLTNENTVIRYSAPLICMECDQINPPQSIVWDTAEQPYHDMNFYSDEFINNFNYLYNEIKIEFCYTGFCVDANIKVFFYGDALLAQPQPVNYTIPEDHPGLPLTLEITHNAEEVAYELATHLPKGYITLLPTITGPTNEYLVQLALHDECAPPNNSIGSFGFTVAGANILDTYGGILHDNPNSEECHPSNAYERINFNPGTPNIEYSWPSGGYECGSGHNSCASCCYYDPQGVEVCYSCLNDGATISGDGCGSNNGKTITLFKMLLDSTPTGLYNLHPTDPGLGIQTLNDGFISIPSPPSTCAEAYPDTDLDDMPGIQYFNLPTPPLGIETPLFHTTDVLGDDFNPFTQSLEFTPDWLWHEIIPSDNQCLLDEGSCCCAHVVDPHIPHVDIPENTLMYDCMSVDQCMAIPNANCTEDYYCGLEEYPILHTKKGGVLSFNVQQQWETCLNFNHCNPLRIPVIYQPHPNYYGLDSFDFKSTFSGQQAPVNINIMSIGDTPPNFEVKFKPQTLTGTNELMADTTWIQTGVPLNTYQQRDSDGYIPIDISTNIGHIDLLDVASIMGYEFKLIQTTPDVGGLDWITAFEVKFYNNANEVVNNFTVGITEPPFMIGAFNASNPLEGNSNSGLFTDQTHPLADNAYNMPEILDSEVWEIQKISIKPISDEINGYNEYNWPEKYILLNKVNYIKQNDWEVDYIASLPSIPDFSHNDVIPLPTNPYFFRFNEDLAGEMGRWNIQFPVEQFTSLTKTHVEISIAEQPPHGTVQIQNPIGCVDCGDGVNDRFLLQYKPHPHWNSSKEVNGSFTLDRFKIRVDELLYENIDTEYSSLYPNRDRYKLKNVFNDIYSTQQCYTPTEAFEVGNIQCSQDIPYILEGYSNPFSFNFTEVVDEYKLVYDYMVWFDYLGTGYNEMELDFYMGGMSLIPDFIRDISVQVDSVSERPIINIPSSWPMRLRETDENQQFRYDLLNIIDFVDYASPELYMSYYDINITNSDQLPSNVQTYYTTDNHIAGNGDVVNTALYIMPPDAPSKIISLIIEHDTLIVDIPAGTGYIPRIEFGISAFRRVVDFPATIVQQQPIFTSLIVHNALLIPFDHDAFQSELVNRFSTEDFESHIIDFEDSRWYHGDTGDELLDYTTNWGLTNSIEDHAASTAYVSPADAGTITVNISNSGLDYSSVELYMHDVELVSLESYRVEFKASVTQNLEPTTRRIKVEMVENDYDFNDDGNSFSNVGLMTYIELDETHSRYVLTFNAGRIPFEHNPRHGFKGINPDTRLRFLIGVPIAEPIEDIPVVGPDGPDIINPHDPFHPPNGQDFNNVEVVISDVSIKQINPNEINIQDITYSGIEMNHMGDRKYQISSIPDYNADVRLGYLLGWIDPGGPPNYTETFLREVRTHGWDISNILDPITLDIADTIIEYPQSQCSSLDNGGCVKQFTGTNIDNISLDTATLEWVDGDGIIQDIDFLITNDGTIGGVIRGTIGFTEVTHAFNAYEHFKQDNYRLIITSHGTEYIFNFSLRINPVNEYPELIPAVDIGVLSYNTPENRYLLPWDFDGTEVDIAIEHEIKIKDDYTPHEQLIVTVSQDAIAPPLGPFTFETDDGFEFIEDYINMTEGPFLITPTIGEHTTDGYTYVNLRLVVNPDFNDTRPAIINTSYVAKVTLSVQDLGVNHDPDTILTTSRDIYFQIGDFPGCQDVFAINYDPYAGMDCSNIGGLCELNPYSEDTHLGIVPTIHNFGPHHNQDAHPSTLVGPIESPEFSGVSATSWIRNYEDISPNVKDIYEIQTLSQTFLDTQDNFSFGHPWLNHPAITIQPLKTDVDCLVGNATENACKEIGVGCIWKNNECQVEEEISIGFWVKVKNQILISDEYEDLAGGQGLKGYVNICYEDLEPDYICDGFPDYNNECNIDNIGTPCGLTQGDVDESNQPDLAIPVGTCIEYFEENLCNVIPLIDPSTPHSPWNVPYINNTEPDFNPFIDQTHLDEWIWVTTTIPLFGWLGEYSGYRPTHVRDWKIGTDYQTNENALILLSEMVMQQTSFTIGGGIVCRQLMDDYIEDDGECGHPALNTCQWTSYEDLQSSGYQDNSCCVYIDFDIDIQTGYNLSVNCHEEVGGFNEGVHTISSVDYLISDHEVGYHYGGTDCEQNQSALNEYAMISGGNVEFYLKANVSDMDEVNMPNRFKLSSGNYQCTTIDIVTEGSLCFGLTTDTFIPYNQVFYYVFYPFGNFERLYNGLITSFSPIENTTLYAETLLNDLVMGGWDQFDTLDALVDQEFHWGYTLPQLLSVNVAKPLSELMAGFVILLKNYLEKSQTIQYYICTEDDVDIVDGCTADGVEVVLPITDKAANLYRTMEFDQNIGTAPGANIADIGSSEFYDSERGRNITWNYFSDNFTHSIAYSELVNNLEDDEDEKIALLERVLKYVYYYPDMTFDNPEYNVFLECQPGDEYIYPQECGFTEEPEFVGYARAYYTNPLTSFSCQYQEICDVDNNLAVPGTYSGNQINAYLAAGSPPKREACCSWLATATFENWENYVGDLTQLCDQSQLGNHLVGLDTTLNGNIGHSEINQTTCGFHEDATRICHFVEDGDINTDNPINVFTDPINLQPGTDYMTGKYLKIGEELFKITSVSFNWFNGFENTEGSYHTFWNYERAQLDTELSDLYPPSADVPVTIYDGVYTEPAEGENALVAACYESGIEETTGEYKHRGWSNMKFNYYDIIKWIHGFLTQDIQPLIESIWPDFDFDTPQMYKPQLNNVHKFLTASGINHFGIPDDLKYGHLIRPETHIFKHQVVNYTSIDNICVRYCTDDDVVDGTYGCEEPGVPTPTHPSSGIPCEETVDCNYVNAICRMPIVYCMDTLTNPNEPFAPDYPNYGCTINDIGSPCGPDYTSPANCAQYDSGSEEDIDDCNDTVGCQWNSIESLCQNMAEGEPDGICRVIEVDTSGDLSCFNEVGTFVENPCGFDRDYGYTIEHECCVIDGIGEWNNDDNYCDGGTTVWYGGEGDLIALCGDGTLDGSCISEIDDSAVCEETESTDLVASINVNPIDTVEEAVNSCLTSDYDVNDNNCTRIGVLGGITKDPTYHICSLADVADEDNIYGCIYEYQEIRLANLPDLDVNSQNFGYLRQNTSNPPDGWHKHPQINVLDAINIIQDPSITIDYFSALYDNFGHYDPSYPSGAVAGTYSWITFQDKIIYDDYITKGLPNNPELYTPDQYGRVFQYDGYYHQGLRFYTAWHVPCDNGTDLRPSVYFDYLDMPVQGEASGVISYIDNMWEHSPVWNEDLDNHWWECSSTYSECYSDLEDLNLLSAFTLEDIGGDDGSANEHLWSRSGISSGLADFKFIANPAYYDSGIIFNVKRNFDFNIIDNIGPEGSAYYYVEPTFGNNPNRIKFFLSGDTSVEYGTYYYGATWDIDGFMTDSGQTITNLWTWGPKQALAEASDPDDEDTPANTFGGNLLTNEQINDLAVTEYQVLIQDPREVDIIAPSSWDDDPAQGNYNPDGYLVYEINEYGPQVHAENIFAEEKYLSSFTVPDQGLTHIYDDNGDFHIKIRALAPLSNFEFTDYWPFLRFCTNDGEGDVVCKDIVDTPSESIEDWVPDTIDVNTLDIDTFGMSEERYDVNIFNVITVQQSIGGHITTPYRFYNPYRGIQMSSDWGGVWVDNTGKNTTCGQWIFDNQGENIPDYENYWPCEWRMAHSMGFFERCNADTRPTLGVFTPVYDNNNNLLNCSGPMDNGGSGTCTDNFYNHIATKDATFNYDSDHPGVADGQNYFYLRSEEDLYGDITPDFQVVAEHLFSIDADVRPEASDLMSLDSKKLPESSMKYWDPVFDKDAFYFNAAPVGIRMFLYARDFGAVPTPCGYSPSNETNPADEWMIFKYVSSIFNHRDYIDFNQIDLISRLTDANPIPPCTDSYIENNMFNCAGYSIGDCPLGNCFNVHYSGLYVCDIDWGDGSPIENPCSDFWSLPKKESYNDFKLLDDKLFYHTYEHPGTFYIRGVVFPMTTPYNVDDLTAQPSGESEIWSSRAFVAAIHINSGRNDSDFEFLGGDIDNPLLPIGEPFNNAQPLPVVGGFSESSLYYKYITSYLGYKPDAPQNTQPVLNSLFRRIGEKTDLIEQASLINENLSFDLYGSATNEYGQPRMLGHLDSYTGSMMGHEEGLLPTTFKVNKLGEPLEFDSPETGFWDFVGKEGMNQMPDEICTGLTVYATPDECGALIHETECVDSPSWNVQEYFCEEYSDTTDCNGGRCCKVRCEDSDAEVITFYPTEHALVDLSTSCDGDSDCYVRAQEFCRCLDLSGFDQGLGGDNVFNWNQNIGVCESYVPFTNTFVSEENVGCGDSSADNYQTNPIVTKNVCSECNYFDTLTENCNNYQVMAEWGEEWQACEAVSTQQSNEEFGIEGIMECVPRERNCTNIFKYKGICRDDCDWLFSEKGTGDFYYDPITGKVDLAHEMTSAEITHAIMINRGKYKRRGELGEYSGELDIQDIKVNLGIEPLYQHFLGDKNCDSPAGLLPGTVSQESCGTNCNIICYNNDANKVTQYFDPTINDYVEVQDPGTSYYLAETEKACWLAGNTPVKCLGVNPDGCYVPIFGVDFKGCCAYTSSIMWDAYIQEHVGSSNIDSFCRIYDTAEICNTQHACSWDEYLENCNFNLNILKTNCTQYLNQDECVNHRCFWDGSNCSGTIYLPSTAELGGSETSFDVSTMPFGFSDAAGPAAETCFFQSCIADHQCPTDSFSSEAIYCLPVWVHDYFSSYGIGDEVGYQEFGTNPLTGEGVKACAECLSPNGSYDWNPSLEFDIDEDDPFTDPLHGYCNASHPYCKVNSCATGMCGAFNLVCNECPEKTKGHWNQTLEDGTPEFPGGASQACVDRYAYGIGMGYEGNTQCMLDPFGCPFDLNCHTQCGCDTSTYGASKLLCGPPTIGCLDPMALNYNEDVSCQAPYGTAQECVYYSCQDNTNDKGIYNCNEALRCKCLVEHIWTGDESHLNDLHPGYEGNNPLKTNQPSWLSAGAAALLSEYNNVTGATGTSVADIISVPCPDDLPYSNCYGLPVVPLISGTTADNFDNWALEVCNGGNCWDYSKNMWAGDIRYGNFGSRTGYWDSIATAVENVSFECTPILVAQGVCQPSEIGQELQDWSMLTHPQNKLEIEWPDGAPSCTGTCGIATDIPTGYFGATAATDCSMWQDNICVGSEEQQLYWDAANPPKLDLKYNMCAEGHVCCPVVHFLSYAGRADNQEFMQPNGEEFPGGVPPEDQASEDSDGFCASQCLPVHLLSGGVCPTLSEWIENYETFKPMDNLIKPLTGLEDGSEYVDGLGEFTINTTDLPIMSSNYTLSRNTAGPDDTPVEAFMAKVDFVNLNEMGFNSITNYMKLSHSWDMRFYCHMEHASQSGTPHPDQSQPFDYTVAYPWLEDPENALQDEEHDPYYTWFFEQSWGYKTQTITSGYDGSCPTRWWCQAEPGGQMTYSPGAHTPNLEPRWGYQGFYEMEECKVATYPPSDKDLYQLCVGDGVNDEEWPYGCPTCEGQCWSEVGLWLSPDLGHSGWYAGRSNGRYSNERFGRSGPLPRRVSAPGCCECPCFCEPWVFKKDGVEYEQPEIDPNDWIDWLENQFGFDWDNPTDLGDVCGDGVNISSGIIDPETGEASGWVQNLEEICSEMYLPNGQSVTDAIACCSNTVLDINDDYGGGDDPDDESWPSGCCYYAPPVDGSHSHWTDPSGNHINAQHLLPQCNDFNMGSPQVALGMNANEGTLCQDRFGNPACEACDWEIPTSLLPGIGGIWCFDPESPISPDNPFNVPPDEAGADWGGTNSCYIPDAQALNSFLFLNHPMMSMMMTLAQSICDQQEACDLGWFNDTLELEIWNQFTGDSDEFNGWDDFAGGLGTATINLTSFCSNMIENIIWNPEDGSYLFPNDDDVILQQIWDWMGYCAQVTSDVHNFHYQIEAQYGDVSNWIWNPECDDGGLENTCTSEDFECDTAQFQNLEGSCEWLWVCGGSWDVSMVGEVMNCQHIEGCGSVAYGEPCWECVPSGITYNYDVPFNYCQPTGYDCPQDAVECSYAPGCTWSEENMECVANIDACNPPQMPEELEFTRACAGPAACYNPVLCTAYCGALAAQATYGSDDGAPATGAPPSPWWFYDDELYGWGFYFLNYAPCSDTPYFYTGRELLNRNNPTSPLYWRNIIPEGYNLLNRYGVQMDVEAQTITNVDLSSNQEYRDSWHFVKHPLTDVTPPSSGDLNQDVLNNPSLTRNACFTYPVLPKLNKYGVLDTTLGLQSLDMIMYTPSTDEDTYPELYVCRTPKIPFLGRNRIVQNLNGKECFGGGDIQSMYFDFEYNWDKFDQCDIAHDNTLYDGIINLDFSELVENQVLNCVNADCVGFVVGDYKVDVERKVNRITGAREFVTNRNKLTNPVLPKITNKEDGAI